MSSQARRIISLGLAILTVAALFLTPIAPQAGALSYSGSASYKSGKFYTALTAVTLTGDHRTDIVNIAKSQVGYQEGGSSSQLSGTVRGSGNYTEYGRWYGMQDMWCAMFVSWCANVAGIPTSVVPSHSYTPTGLNWFINKGQAYSRAKVANGTYTPQPGDIIYFKSERNENITNHVGIVTKYSNGTVYTVEGNTSSATISTNGGAVCEKSYSISNTYIVYICSPNYTTNSSSTNDKLKSVVFDATYYANKYSDLKSTYGTDATKLYNHFLTSGISEGRQASPIFDVKYYLENNSAVKTACGSDYMAAYEYFLETGYKDSAKTAAPANLGESFYSKIQFTSGKNLSLSDTNVIIYSDSDKPAQVWEFVRLSAGGYKIINTKNSLCLTVADNATSSGTNVEISVFTGASGQKWYIYENNGKYVLRPYSSNCCVLDVEGASTEDVTNVEIATNDNATGQLFTLSPITTTAERMTDIGISTYYKLTSATSGGNLDISGTNVVSSTANSEASQVWRFIHQTDGSYKIVNQETGNVLEVSGGTDADGTNVKTGASSDTAAQRWYVYRLGDHLTLRPACSDTRRLEISSGNAQIKASTSNQKFTLTKVTYLTDVSPIDMGDDFYARLTNKASGKNMSLSDTNVISYPASTAPAQIWRFVRQSNGSYKLINQKNEMLLDLAATAANGTNVCIADASGATSQTWYVYIKEGKYMLRPVSSKSYLLTVENGSTEDAANIELATASFDDSQLFTIQETTIDNSVNSVGATAEQMVVIRKIMYAVETGGQVYGNVDYSDFTEAYTNTSEEHAITIGGGQWFGVEAKKLLNLIRTTDPATFASLDTAGIANDLDTADWSTYKLSATSAKAKCIVKIISSDVGIRCQDQLIDQQMIAYMAEARALGVTDLDAVMMCANLRHLGGLSAVKRVLGKTATPYTLDNIYAALQTDTGNQVGAFTSRQKFVYNTLKKYITNNSTSNVKYLPACSSSEESLVTALANVGVTNVDDEYRMRLAIANGIKDYAYTADQNIQLLDLLKKGMLIDPKGTILTGWQTFTGGKRYYYDAAGARQYGWLTVDGKTYYLDPSTGVMTTGSRTIDGVAYNFGTDGVLVSQEDCNHIAHTQSGACTACGESVSHTYSTSVTAPDCINQGYTTYTCECGKSYEDNFVDALGHSYANNVCDICGLVDPDFTPSKQKIGLSQTGDTEVTVLCAPIEGATHYEVVYSETKTMDTYEVLTFTTNNCAVTSLPTSDYFYFKARAYKLVNGTKAYLTAYSSVKGIYVQPSYVEATSQIEYTFSNLPNNRVMQAFYYDAVEHCIYITQVAPVNDAEGNLVREDTILSKCRINEDREAVCESYLYILNGGHGVILQGYRDDNNELRLYVGSTYKAAVGYCTGIVNISYDEAYANKYDPVDKVFRNADGEITTCPSTRIDGVDYKTTILNSGDNLEPYKKGRILNIQNIMADDEEFVKFDFLRSQHGEHFVVIKFKRSDKQYIRALRINADLDALTTTQEKAINFNTLTFTQFHERSVERTLISGGWQSTGVFGTTTAPHFMINGNVGFNGTDYNLHFIDVRSDRVYNVTAATSGYTGAEEIEGLQFINGRVYFAHKITSDIDDTKIITIQSFDEVIQATCSHNNSETVTKEPTCTENGSSEVSCSECGLIGTIPIEMTGHNYGSFTVTKAPTCTEEGTISKTCSNCGDTYTDSLAATGHSYENGSCTACGTADPDYTAPSTPSEPVELDYYLVGYINGANYGCEEDYKNLGEYKFVDGKLTATFTSNSYVFVKTSDNAGWYMTNGWLGEVNSATLYSSEITGENSNKLFVPGGVELTFTLVENGNGTLTLSYTYPVDPVVLPTLTGKSFSLSFESEILVNFYYAISDTTDVAQHGMLVFYTDPGAANIENADDVYTSSSAGSNFISTTDGIAAKEMGDDRYYCAYAELTDGTYVYSPLYQYSPKKYSTNMLAKSSTSEAQKALCVAMLNYGAAAQEYFGYKTDDLMNAGLTAQQQALITGYNASFFTGAVAVDSSKIGSFGATSGFSGKSASVSFEGAFAINYYFVPGTKVSGDLKLYVWDPEAYASASTLTTANASAVVTMAKQDNGSYWGQAHGIPAKNLDKTYYVSGVYTDASGNTCCTGVIAYSLSRYCMNNANGNMGELAQATAMYGYYAKQLLG